MIRREKLWKECGILVLATLSVYGVLFLISGCNRAQPSDQQLRDQAAQTTEQVKQGAKEAAADAKVAAADAERKVNDIADGVKEGLNSDKSPSGDSKRGLVDINTASADQLATLPGLSDEQVKLIIEKRPFSSPYKLVSKGVLSEAEYRRISAKITAS
jgi:DNA uptake protein ComE-like DNA-binding protein